MAENKWIKAESLKNLKNLMHKNNDRHRMSGKRRSEKEEFGEETPKSGQLDVRVVPFEDKKGTSLVQKGTSKNSEQVITCIKVGHNKDITRTKNDYHKIEREKNGRRKENR